MGLKKQLEENVIQFENSRIEKIEKRLIIESKQGYRKAEFNSQFYSTSIIEYFKLKGINHVLEFYSYDELLLKDPKNVKRFTLIW